MDRDRRWEKIQLCYEMMTGEKNISEKKPLEYVQEEYDSGRTDEFFNPVLLNKDYLIKKDDPIFSLIFDPIEQFNLLLPLTTPTLINSNKNLFPLIFFA